MSDIQTETRGLPPTAEEIVASMPREADARVPALIDPARAFLPVAMSTIREVAEMLAFMPGLAPEFDKPENCLAVAYQAARWQLDPVFVAQKAYFANKRIGYEAQLIHALINKNAPLQGRLQISYGYSDPERRVAAFRFCEVRGLLIGETKPSPYTSPTFAQIKVKNSPLWFSDLDQQFAYYSVRAWGRRWVPEVLGGVYAKEEIELIRVVGEDSREARDLFSDDVEPQDATFSDAPQPTEAELKAHDRVQAKADGVQDSRDPRDAPANAAPPKEEEAAGLPEAREWLARRQTEIMKLTDPVAAAREWQGVITDKQWGRIKSYAQPLANAAHRAVQAHIQTLKAPK